MSDAVPPTPQMGSAECRICQRSRDEHRVAEREGAVNHRFSENGQLEHLEKAPEKHSVPSALAVDPILRLILVQKGLVTTAELDQAEQELAATGVLRSSARPGE